MHNSDGRLGTPKIAIIVIVLVIIGALVVGYMTIQKNKAYKEADIGSNASAGTYRHITYHGDKYDYNSNITNILVVGVDSTGKMQTESAYGSAARSDVIMLLSLDKYNHSTTAIAFSRSTMAEIQQFDLDGTKIGKAYKQLAYAFEEGNGGKASCENTADAVSNLLGGIPIDHYIVVNVNAIPKANELVGGVTVTAPNDDLADEYDISKGDEVTLTDETAQAFLQYRDIDKEYSNEGRMERAHVYMNAYMDAFQKLLKKNVNENINLIEDSGLKEYMLTDITRNQYVGLFNLLNDVNIDDISYFTPDGTNEVKSNLERFIINKSILKKELVKVFYIKSR